MGVNVLYIEFAVSKNPVRKVSSMPDAAEARQRTPADQGLSATDRCAQCDGELMLARYIYFSSIALFMLAAVSGAALRVYYRAYLPTAPSTEQHQVVPERINGRTVYLTEQQASLFHIPDWVASVTFATWAFSYLRVRKLHGRKDIGSERSDDRSRI
jgi:hypothetical protein